ncbi:MAG: hypothetical protein P4L71_21160 [Acetobacteraceae bacterium]|nr:hypothetical protein [Acetobacteraceae bacterium]
MQQFFRRAAVVSGLLLGSTTIALASPALHVSDHGAAPQASNIVQADYHYNHQRYHHRSWDKRHHRWHYYN